MKNPRYANEDQTIILLDSDDDGSHVVVAEPTGDYADVFEAALAEQYGPVTAYVEPPAPPVTSDQVKAEAYRRIVAVCPEWKQRNLTAQASILAEKGRANWTAEELAAWEAGEAIWQAIAAIRAASDQIEGMDPIPSDYSEDSYWP